ncbi:MAG: NADH oxidase, partial [Rhodoferax sp.]
MTTPPPRTGLQLRSLVKPGGELEISLLSIATPDPAADEVVVRIEATPINPSDIGLLFGAADINTAKVSGTATNPVVTAQIPQQLMKGMAARLGQS